MIPPAFDIDRALADVHWLVRQLGPRPHQSTAEHAAVEGVSERLKAAGWDPELIAGSPLACRGNGSILYLAHVDSVPESPGAVDNASGVAILLELARTSEATNLCLGFPIGEEYGLRGSRDMAAAWSRAAPDLVVSLDLIGEGNPTAIDLNRPWGSTELRWMTEITDIDIPILHRAVGRALPQWRSDHGPFAARGALAFQIMTRGKDVVFTRYHQNNDDTVDGPSMLATAAALEAMASNGPPPRGKPDPALPLLGHVLPGSAVWGIWWLGLLSGLPGVTRVRSTTADAIRLGVMMLASTLVMWGLLAIGFPTTEAEETAQAVVGISATGWWNAAPWAVGAAWLTWLVVWRALPGTGHPAFMAALISIPAAWLDPLIALPFSLAALLVRIHPLLGLLPAAMVIRPEPLREFAFWGLLSPWMWPVLFVFTWTAIGTIRKKP